jgi:hypothetical protein
MARPAYRKAIESFEQALSALQHLPEQRDTREQAIDLRLAMRHALIALGAFGAMFDHLCAAERLAAPDGALFPLPYQQCLLSHYRAYPTPAALAPRHAA